MPKWVKIGAPLLVIAFLVAFFVVGWIFSSKIIKVDLQKVEYEQTIQAVVGDEYKIKGSSFNSDGIIGGFHGDGSSIGVFSAPFSNLGE